MSGGLYLLRIELTRQMWTTTYDGLIGSSTSPANSKLSLLAARLQSPGLPLHLTLDAVGLPIHRQALASFLCGDWFLARYAHNYFARILGPQVPRHLALVQDQGIDGSTVCLSCWHFRREIFFEDEYHVVCVCPEYAKGREELLRSLPLNTTLDTSADLLALLGNRESAQLSATARFLARARQVRRRLKCVFERYSSSLETCSFSAKRAVWKMRRRPSCRHGVLFSRLPEGGCKCMQAVTTSEDWISARYMPSLNHELKAVVAVPFNKLHYQRLGTIQARARHFGW